MLQQLYYVPTYKGKPKLQSPSQGSGCEALSPWMGRGHPPSLTQPWTSSHTLHKPRLSLAAFISSKGLAFQGVVTGAEEGDGKGKCWWRALTGHRSLAPAIGQHWDPGAGSCPSPGLAHHPSELRHCSVSTPTNEQRHYEFALSIFSAYVFIICWVYFWFLLATVLKRAFLLSLIFQFYIAGLEMLRCFSIRVKLEKKKIILIFYFFLIEGVLE